MKLTTGYKKPIDSDNSVLLAGGGHKSIQQIINDYGALSIAPAVTFNQAINADILGNATTADRLKNDRDGQSGTTNSWQECKIENGVIKYYDRANAASVIINYNNDSNAEYQMLWGSGNNIYGTAGIYCNPSLDYMYATAYYVTSDQRKKKNIIPISESIRQFNWADSGKQDYGLIAQEVEKHNPELVYTLENGYKSVNYISALCKIIANLENKIAKLEKQLNS